MGEPEENLPEFFRIDFYSQFFIGELYMLDNEALGKFSGSIQYFDNFVTCNAPSKRLLIDTAEEMCYLVLSYAIHLVGHQKTIEILKTPYYLN